MGPFTVMGGASAMPQAGPAGPTPGGAPVGLPQPGQAPQTNYEAVTQADGTVLLHVKMPDGSLGPVVQIVKPPRPKAGQAQANPAGPSTV